MSTTPSEVYVIKNESEGRYFTNSSSWSGSPKIYKTKTGATKRLGRLPAYADWKVKRWTIVEEGV